MGGLYFGPWYLQQPDQSSAQYSADAGSLMTELFGDNNPSTSTNNNNSLLTFPGCVQYPSGYAVDSAWKATRAFSILATLLGGLFAVGLVLAPCFRRSGSSANATGWTGSAFCFLVILPLFQGLTFLFLQTNLCQNDSNNSNIDCKLVSGTSGANIAAVIFWFLTGISMLALGAPKHPERPPAETQTVTYERTVDENGAEMVVQTKVVKGTVATSNDLPLKEEP